MVLLEPAPVRGASVQGDHLWIYIREEDVQFYEQDVANAARGDVVPELCGVSAAVALYYRT